MHGVIRYAVNATGTRRCVVVKNGAAVPTFVESMPSIDIPTTVGCMANVRLAAGDYVKLLAFQTSGSSLLVESAAFGFAR